MFLMNNIEMKKLTISSRTFAFAAMLALNQVIIFIFPVTSLTI